MILLSARLEGVSAAEEEETGAGLVVVVVEALEKGGLEVIAWMESTIWVVDHWNRMSQEVG